MMISQLASAVLTYNIKCDSKNDTGTDIVWTPYSHNEVPAFR